MGDGLGHSIVSRKLPLTSNETLREVYVIGIQKETENPCIKKILEIVPCIAPRRWLNVLNAPGEK